MLSTCNPLDALKSNSVSFIFPLPLTFTFLHSPSLLSSFSQCVFSNRNHMSAFFSLTLLEAIHSHMTVPDKNSQKSTWVSAPYLFPFYLPFLCSARLFSPPLLQFELPRAQSNRCAPYVREDVLKTSCGGGSVQEVNDNHLYQKPWRCYRYCGIQRV